jgi:hypothetical protein
VPSGAVVQVVQAGYMIRDRVLRPTLVGVAKGGAKPVPANGNEPNSAALSFCLSIIPRVEPEGMLFGKPVPTHRVAARGHAFPVL